MLADNLKTLLASNFVYYLKAHQFHWNVEGPDFSELHNFFQEIYEDAYGSIDLIAENIRKLDDYAPFSLQKFLDLRTLDFKDVQPNPKAMAKSLLTANEALLKSLKKAFDEAQKKDEQGIMNFLADRIDNHQKWSWQLRASTK